VQNRKDVDVAYYIGSGKVTEIKEIIDSSEVKITTVVFDVELSGSKARNLEDALGVTVLDRSKVILDIFAQRAQSAEGKLQVELAQLKYNLPRLVGTGGVLAKMRNGVGMRGPGEKFLELDKRTIRDQVFDLEQKLKKLSANRTLSKQQGNKSGKPRACIVGYTNSGKSTLHSTLAKSGAYIADKLFATLDPKTANLYIDGLQILLTDTVGFVNKLPHEFIKAFESTLDEAKYADLLLHVIDVSNPDYLKQIAVVEEVLAKINANHVPTLTVFNKVDKLSAQSKRILTEARKNDIFISALNNTGLDTLKLKIKNLLE